MTVFDTADLTAASFSLVIFGLAATAILLLIGTSWVGRSWKVPVTLCALAALVGVAAAYEGRAALGADGMVPVVYHYVGWAVSQPLQVMALYFFAAAVTSTSGKPIGPGVFWRILVIAVLMVFVRYLGEASYMNATLAFLIGLAFWLYILGELYFGRMDEAVQKDGNDATRRGFFWLRLIMTVGWAIYPLGNFLTSFVGVTDNGAISTAYNVADITNRMAFGIAMLATAAIASQEEKSNV